MRITTDTSGIDESGDGFELLPDGIYLFQIEGVEDKQTKAGDPMAKLTLRILKGEYAERLVWDNIVIPKEGSPAFKIMGRTKHFLHCIGEPHEGAITIDTDRWRGKAVSAQVGRTTYNDKESNVITAYILEEKGGADDNIPF